MSKTDTAAPQEALSPDLNIKTAESDVKGIVGRIRRHHSGFVKSKPKREGVSPEGVASQMRRNGYPERAIDRIRAGMSGRGFERAQQLLPVVQRSGSIIIVHGDRGPGKTQMATWWAHQLAMSGRSCGRYVKALDLLGDLKATWSSSSRSTEAQVMDRYRRAPFLVVDEVQERPAEAKLSEWASQVLTNIVDHRYDSMRSTVLIGNFTREALPDVIPASIISRAEECGGTVFCDWPSYRGGSHD